MQHDEKDTVEYIDGMGESGLKKLRDRWIELSENPETRDKAYFKVFHVPLAAQEEAHRSLKGKHPTPPTWKDIREQYGVGRYEVVLVGPPSRPKAKGIIRKVGRALVYAALPWLDTREMMVPLGRASAAMFDTIKFEDMKPPMPKPLGTQEQPSLFNPDDVAIPKYAAGSDTSFLAAEAIAPLVTHLQNKVLEAVLKEGTHGATCDEVEVALGMPHQTASPRINELKEDDLETGRPQLLYDSGKRRKTQHGQLATVWIHRTVLHG